MRAREILINSIPMMSRYALIRTVSLMYMYPSNDAMIPMGMLIKKIYSQPTKVVMIPPSTMPSIAPLIHPSEIYPKDLPRTFGGKVSATIAPLFACMEILMLLIRIGLTHYPAISIVFPQHV
jgi:hypothetical protein